MRSAAFTLVLAACQIAACATAPPLPAKSAAVPDGVDISGDWQMQATSRDSSRRIRDVERKAAGPGKSLIPGKGKTTRSGNDDVQIHVFIESGETLRISQTDYGLFISFDRAVVEEYRFGERRMVNVGPILAERVSGWENDAYVVVTRDKDGTVLTESYRLQGADTLVRRVQLTGDSLPALDVEQVFDRR